MKILQSLFAGITLVVLLPQPVNASLDYDLSECSLNLTVAECITYLDRQNNEPAVPGTVNYKVENVLYGLLGVFHTFSAALLMHTDGNCEVYTYFPGTYYEYTYSDCGIFKVIVAINAAFYSI